MKVNSVKTNRAASHGFTLIEMIGVLAVIAILAAMLLPKVFSAINDSRVNNAAVSVETPIADQNRAAKAWVGTSKRGDILRYRTLLGRASPAAGCEQEVTHIRR